jgi:hypothetical protein
MFYLFNVKDEDINNSSNNITTINCVFILNKGFCCGRDRMLVGFTTTCTIRAYHH